jgi:hypothetical protein
MRSSSKVHFDQEPSNRPIDYAALAERAKASIRMFSVSITPKEKDAEIEAARQQLIEARLALSVKPTTRGSIEREVAEFISATKAELGPLKSQYTSRIAQTIVLTASEATTVRAKPNDSLTKIVKSLPELVTLAREAITNSVECGTPIKDKVGEHSATMAAVLALGSASNLQHIDRLNADRILAVPSQGQLQAVVDLACKSKVAPKGVFTYAAISALSPAAPASWQKVHGSQSTIVVASK